MADLNMTTEKVNEFVEKYVADIKKLQELTVSFNDSRKKLESWQGPAKRAYEDRVVSTMPAFEELIEVTSSYANVANNASNYVAATEKEILNGMMG